MGESIGIVGYGNSGRALASHLSAQGRRVRVLVRSPHCAVTLREARRVRATGRLEGEFPIEAVTGDAEDFSRRCESIFVATVTNAYPDVARRLAPYLRAGQNLVLFSGKLAGSVEVERVLEDQGVKGVRVVETDALFAARAQSDGSVWIRGQKKWTLFSAPRASSTREVTDFMKDLFPALEPADNVIQRGLTDFGAVCHPVVMLANLNAVDRKTPFSFYYEGLTDRTARMLERLESEFRAVAEAYGTTLIPMSELLKRYYGCHDGTVLDAMRSVPNYRHSVAPQSLDHRYLTEDVPCTLVPLFQLARRAGVDTPMLDSIVHLASVICEVDFLKTGRTLARLGWASLTRRGIVRWMQG